MATGSRGRGRRRALALPLDRIELRLTAQPCLERSLKSVRRMLASSKPSSTGMLPASTTAQCAADIHKVGIDVAVAGSLPSLGIGLRRTPKLWPTLMTTASSIYWNSTAQQRVCSGRSRVLTTRHESACYPVGPPNA